MGNGGSLQKSTKGPTPTAPLWHMAKVAVGDSKESFDLLQAEIESLTKKAKRKQSFTADEKEFLTDLYECLWYGGNYKGFTEAAELADHYVNGKGAADVLWVPGQNR